MVMIVEDNEPRFVVMNYDAYKAMKDKNDFGEIEKVNSDLIDDSSRSENQDLAIPDSFSGEAPDSGIDSHGEKAEEKNEEDRIKIEDLPF